MDLNQVVIEVRDFHEAVEFYQTLGLKMIVSARDDYARFELPSGTSTLSLYLADQPNPKSTTLYFEVPDVDATYDDLRGKGIRFETKPEDKRWLWREAYLQDPSGNKLCIYHAGDMRKFPPWRLPETKK